MQNEIQQWKRGDVGFRSSVEDAQYNVLPTRRSPECVLRPATEDELVRAIVQVVCACSCLA